MTRYYNWLKKNSGILFLLILLAQLFAGIYAFTVQLFVPFSAAKITAQFIRQNNLDRFLIAGDQDVALEPVSGYLNKKTFFFSRNDFGTYLVYDRKRKIPLESDVLPMADRLLQAHGDTILMVMNYPIKDTLQRNLKKIRFFENSIRYDEKYYLYLLSPPEKRETPANTGKK